MKSNRWMRFKSKSTNHVIQISLVGAVKIREERGLVRSVQQRKTSRRISLQTLPEPAYEGLYREHEPTHGGRRLLLRRRVGVKSWTIVGPQILVGNKRWFFSWPLDTLWI